MYRYAEQIQLGVNTIRIAEEKYVHVEKRKTALIEESYWLLHGTMRLVI